MARSDIEFDTTGVRLVRRPLLGKPTSAGVAWSDVRMVEARRGSAGGPAELLFYGADGPVLTVDAGQRGFEALRTALPSQLRHADEAWWAALNAEPVQERRYLVWDRP